MENNWQPSTRFDESNHRSLLQLYSASGQRHALVEHFERMRGLLKEELGVEPLPETVELYRSLVARSGTQLPANRSLKQNEAPKQAWRLRTTISLPMIGRDAELAQISAWLNEAMAGKLSVICVQGVAGSGKTRLLHEATAHFHYPVWLGSGQQVAQTTPYLAILRALRSGLAAFDPALLTQAFRALPDLWLAEASRLLPEFRDLRPDLRLPPTLPRRAGASWLFEALTRLAVVLAQAQGGAFLIVDDLHDADSESFDWLLNLAHHLQNQRTPLAISVAFDSTIERPALKNWISDLQHDGTYRPLQLAPLSGQALTTLVQTVQSVQSDKAGSLPTLQIPSLVQKLAEYSEGTPLIVLELLRTWLDQGVSAHDPLANSEASVSLSIPESVHSLLRSRIAQLDPIAAQLFDVFALAQTALEMEEAQRIAGRDEFATAEAINQLLAMQLVQADGLYYSVSHTILGEMALTAIGKTRRRLLHRRAGEVLQQRVDGAALAAFHFAAAAMTEATTQIISQRHNMPGHSLPLNQPSSR